MNSQGKKSILAIFAHPDDETLGCGGTLARYAREGCEVRILICGEGATARYDSPEAASGEELASLDRDLQKAGEVLGAKEVVHLDWPDNRFDSRPLLDLVKAVEKNLDKISPQIIFTHHPGDLNIDHRYVYDAVMAGARPLPESKIEAIYACEVLSSTGWRGQGKDLFLPNFYVDIHETLAKKLNAMACYDTEAASFPHPRSPEAIRALAQFRGAESGLLAAEAFCLVRQIHPLLLF
jgi:LmbE family N-acetylglucosaminyl deacetylase